MTVAKIIKTTRNKKTQSISTPKPSAKPTKGNILLIFVQTYRRALIGGILFWLMGVTLLNLLGITTGIFSQWWADLLTLLFGWGAVPSTFILVLFGGWLVLGRFRKTAQGWPLEVVVGIELMIVVVLSLIHLVTTRFSDILILSQTAHGGGLIGWGVSSLLLQIFGPILTVLLLLGLGLAALGLIFHLTISNVKERATWLYMMGKRLANFLKAEQRQVTWLGSTFFNKLSELKPTRSDRLDLPANILKKRATSNNGSTVVEPTSPPSNPTSPKTTLSELGQLSLKLASAYDDGLTLSKQVAKSLISAMPKRRYPPLSLLTTPKKNLNYNPNIEIQAKIIEETLYSFGVPVKVKEKNPGPTITQFGLELGTIERKMADGTMGDQRIRVRKVVALSDDLALALSASPIRIEAPVPGRPLVGIEVPNTDKSMVPLRGVLESDVFRKSEIPLRVALGSGVSGEPVIASLMQMPHLLIAGATGSGKSVCINALISALLFTHSPEQLRLLMIDPKMVELTSYNGIPHLIAPVVTDFEQVVGALAWGTREMEHRYQLFAKTGVRSINSYNQKIEHKDEQLPYIVIIIDELADLMMLAPDDVERYICRMAQMARATGIHLVIATQRPSVDVITGLIKANFPARIAFAVTSQIDSRVILDASGAEKLLGQGDMLYQAPDSSKLMRLQGCFISDSEIQNLVNYWKQATVEQTGSEPAKPKGKLPWADLIAEAEKDDMLEEAIKVVMEGKRVSTSLLQRRLGVGYPRAARLIDQLEKEGVIGPAEGNKPREVLWSKDKDESDYPELKEDIAGT